MNITDIIDKKLKNCVLSYAEIKKMVMDYVDGTINDEDMTSFLKAIVKCGMTYEETSDLTKVMLESGKQIDLSCITGIKVDKHSTGGVGDKTTLVLLPLVASCGVKVAKMSGRSLGYTGGTIDKLESIPGFKVDMDQDSFIKQVNDIGLALVSQSGNLVPADKKIYALRDVTNTVSSIPLIASSIMSKKLASGADKIVLDVKVGRGALLEKIEDAKTLAQYMVHIGKSHGKETVCVLSNMNEPLGFAIGNMVEVEESISALKDEGPSDLKELVLTLGSIMVSLGLNIDGQKAYDMCVVNLKNGSAYAKFEEFVKAQNGTLNLINDSKKFSVKAHKTGYITYIDTLKLGELVRHLGAGRVNIDDVVDSRVGFILSKKVGDFVLKDEELLKVYLTSKDCLIRDLLDCFKIENDVCDKEKLILDIIK